MLHQSQTSIDMSTLQSENAAQIDEPGTKPILLKLENGLVSVIGEQSEDLSQLTLINQKLEHFKVVDQKFIK